MWLSHKSVWGHTKSHTKCVTSHILTQKCVTSLFSHKKITPAEKLGFGDWPKIWSGHPKTTRTKLQVLNSRLTPKREILGLGRNWPFYRNYPSSDFPNFSDFGPTDPEKSLKGSFWDWPTLSWPSGPKKAKMACFGRNYPSSNFPNFSDFGPADPKKSLKGSFWDWPTLSWP